MREVLKSEQKGGAQHLLPSSAPGLGAGISKSLRDPSLCGQDRLTGVVLMSVELRLSSTRARAGIFICLRVVFHFV